MAAPILWAPGIFVLLLQANSHAHKQNSRFKRGILWVWGGGEVPIYYYGRGDSSDFAKLQGTEAPFDQKLQGRA